MSMFSYVHEDKIIDKNDFFTAYNANYAKDMIAIQCAEGQDGWKSRVSYLASKFTNRFSHRENAYIMSKAQYRKFKQAFEESNQTTPSGKQKDIEEELNSLVGKVVVISNNGFWTDYLFGFDGGNYQVYNTNFTIDQVKEIEFGLNLPVIRLK